MNTEIILDTKLVGNVQGVFYVPSYQRGYRWGKEEVTRLLEDIYTNGNKTYCLQPVVVRKDGDRYELIDGQQRYVVCENASYLVKNVADDSIITTIEVPQNEKGIDTEDRVQTLKTQLALI